MTYLIYVLYIHVLPALTFASNIFDLQQLCPVPVDGVPQCTIHRPLHGLRRLGIPKQVLKAAHPRMEMRRRTHNTV